MAENNEKDTRKKKKSKGKFAGTIIGRTMAVIFSTVLMIFLALYGVMWIMCHGPSTSASELFVTTVKETGAMKFLAKWYFSQDEIDAISAKNSMGTNDEELDKNMINIGGDDDDVTEEDTDFYDQFTFDENGIATVSITGRTYTGTMMIVKDPSKVSVATIYPWSDYNKSKDGSTLDVLVASAGAIAGINGGEYNSDGNWGGMPKGLVVCNGEIQYNEPQTGDVMIGFSTDNILIIKDISGMSASQVEELVQTESIRDAVSFKDIDDGDSNHFTKLIINGVATEVNGTGSGANPRTVIGQRSDGTVLMFVTDGRGHDGHIGATAADLIGIMQQYGAVNAANLDGGSSSSMVYNGEFLMTSVTLYYSTSSWKLPTAFVVK